MTFFVFSLFSGALLLLIARFVGKGIDYKLKLQIILASFVLVLIAYLARQIYPLWVVSSMLLLLGLCLAYYLSLQLYRGKETSEETSGILLATADRRGESAEQIELTSLEPLKKVEEHTPIPAAYSEEKEASFIAEQLNETFDQVAASLVTNITTNPIMELQGSDNGRDSLTEEEMEFQRRYEEMTLEEDVPSTQTLEAHVAIIDEWFEEDDALEKEESSEDLEVLEEEWESDVHIEKERRALFEELERDWSPRSIQSEVVETPLNEQLATEREGMRDKELETELQRGKR